MSKGIRIVLVLLAVCLLFLTGVRAQNQQEVEFGGPKYGGTLTIATSTSPRNMDSRWTTWGSSFHALKNEPMFTCPPTAGPDDVVPAGWLESYEFPESKTLILHIKEGVTYQDGVPVNAENVKWGILKRKTTEELWAGDIYLATPDDPEKSLKVLDDYTLQIDLIRPIPTLLTYLASYTGWAWASETPRARERYGEDYGLKKINGAVAYGNGPFILKEWVKGDHLTFVRNESYWWSPSFIKHQGPAYLEEIIVKIIPESTTAVKMLEKGEVDFISGVGTTFVKELQENPDIDVQTAIGGRDLNLVFNVTNPPLDDIKVRKALSYAVKREPIAQAAFQGLAEPAHTLYIAKSRERDTTHRVNFDPEKAKSLLEEAGWTDTDGDGIREKDGKDLVVKLWASNFERTKLTTEIIQQQWKQIGVKADITLMTETTMLDRTETGDHEAVLRLNYSTSFGDQIWFYDPDSVWGYPHISFSDTPKLRELVQASYNAATMEDYVKTGDDLVNYVTDQAYRCPLVRPEVAIAFNKDLQDVQIRGESYWSTLPFFHDVYWKHIYEENLNKEE